MTLIKINLRMQRKSSIEVSFLTVISKLKVSTSDDSLILAKKLNSETCKEIGIDSRNFFSNEKITQDLIELIYKFENDEKVFEFILRAITNISFRFSIKNKEVYQLLIKNINSKNNRIKFIIASHITYWDEFDFYPEKWDYIISIPKISPKKYSISLFRRIISQNINNIPLNIIEEVLLILVNYISKNDLHLVIEEHYTETIIKLKSRIYNSI